MEHNNDQDEPAFASFLAWLLAGCVLPAAMPDAASAQNGNVTLPVVNGTPFTSGPVDVDGAHCGWNYVLGGGAFTPPRCQARPISLSVAA